MQHKLACNTKMEVGCTRSSVGGHKGRATDSGGNTSSGGDTRTIGDIHSTVDDKVDVAEVDNRCDRTSNAQTGSVGAAEA